MDVLNIETGRYDFKDELTIRKSSFLPITESYIRLLFDFLSLMWTDYLQIIGKWSINLGLVPKVKFYTLYKERKSFRTY